MPSKSVFSVCAALLALALGAAAPAAFAQAQWQWLDKDGRKVFSDQAPPPDVPDNKIIKRPFVAPRASTAGVTPPANVPAAGGTPTAAVPPRPSGVDKDLMEKAKEAQDADAKAKKADEEKLAKARAENCSRAREAKASLDSGARLARFNAKGEREIMDDDARAAEMKRVQAGIQSDCGPAK